VKQIFFFEKKGNRLTRKKIGNLPQIMPPIKPKLFNIMSKANGPAQIVVAAIPSRPMLSINAPSESQ
jgi:hypothetical protein